MVDRLFVIVGAGASHGCAHPGSVPTNGYLTPPLVTDLFRPTAHLDAVAAQVLPQYPLAKLAAADLRGLDDSLAIEDVIRRRYKESSNVLDKRIFRAIPPYLQDLLHRVSYSYTDFPQNYESLVTHMLRLKEVVFVSLNYDVILDNVLGSVDPPTGDMDWYVNPHRGWSLIKLHGSVNWSRQITSAGGREVFTDPPEKMSLSDRITVTPSTNLWKIRGFSSSGGSHAPGDLRYPVVSVPIGQADELACPNMHVRFLQDRLATTTGLHLLFLGYSGNDREVLALIRNSGSPIETLTIVDRSHTGASETAARLSRDHSLAAHSTMLVDGDFTDWVEQGGLSEYTDLMSRVSN
jgi:hypothetical protein